METLYSFQKYKKSEFRTTGVLFSGEIRLMYLRWDTRMWLNKRTSITGEFSANQIWWCWSFGFRHYFAGLAFLFLEKRI